MFCYIICTIVQLYIADHTCQKRSNFGVDYVGDVQFTVTGWRCLPWDNTTYDRPLYKKREDCFFNDGQCNFLAGHNFCRNPILTNDDLTKPGTPAWDLGLRPDKPGMNTAAFTQVSCLSSDPDRSNRKDASKYEPCTVPFCEDTEEVNGKLSLYQKKYI